MNADHARQYFRETYGGEPDVIGSAPGRVNLIGEHTDYNGGQVLPLAIDRRTYVALRARTGASTSRVVSETQSVSAEFDIHSILRSGQWWDYVTGVCAAFASGGARLPQIEASVTSDLPTGSGLSSSAALELANSRPDRCSRGRLPDAQRSRTSFLGCRESVRRSGVRSNGSICIGAV